MDTKTVLKIISLPISKLPERRSRYRVPPTLEGALLSAMFHVEKGRKVKWAGGPHVWFGHVDRQATPKFGVDVVKSETE